jgi:hypothetical protein
MPIALSLAVLFASAAPSPTLLADYVEDRSNRVFGCYCEWSSENVISGREAILVWHIRSGCYRGVNLTGVSLAAVIEGEDNLSRGHPPRKSVLILSEAAGPEQRAAAEAWVRERYGALLGTVLQVYTLPLTFLRRGELVSLKVGDQLQLEMRRARPETDTMQGATHWYDPFIALEEPTLATSLRSKYSGGEFSRRWDWSDPGITGYFGTIRMEGDEMACAGRPASALP